MKIRFSFSFFALLFFVTPFTSSAQNKKHERKLVFAIDLIRHGDRTPIIEIPAAHHRWTEGLGQLTPLGMHQEYELGKKFHQRYIDQEKLLPRTYQPGTLYVRSTDIDRTLMSAQSVLMGLYPPGTGPFLHPTILMNWFALPYGFQPIPIHTTPQNEDMLLISHHNRAEIIKSIEAIPEYQQKEEELRPHFAAWSKATGVSIKDVIDVERLGDALYIYKLKNVKLPKELSRADIEMILNASTLTFKKSILEAACSEKNLLIEIAHHLKQAAEKKSSLKYLLYSAHDTTIMGLLRAMNVPLKEVPHYASDFNILLYENGKHHFEVEVTLNGEPVNFPSSVHGSASLQDFLSLSEK